MKTKMIDTAMMKSIYRNGIIVVVLTMIVSSCVPELTVADKKVNTPDAYSDETDTANTVSMNWKKYFSDPYLVALIDTALMNNQEMNIVAQEIEISRNEVMARKGEYLPFVNLGFESDLEKVGEFTRNGAVESNLNIKDVDKFPEPLGNMMLGLNASWEVDIWKKLRNAKQSAYKRYLGSVEGRNFLVTNLIAEIANTYYELLALDNQLAIVERNINIQSDALNIVKIQKQSAKVTELAVKRFEAQVLDTKSLQFLIKQQIVETENKLNYLVGRFPQSIERDASGFQDLMPKAIQTGIPSQLLSNRPDIRQAEMNLQAAKLDVASTKANFYPSLDIRAGLGFEAFKPQFLLSAPESLMYSAAGGLLAPLVNRRAIQASYMNAGASQVQAMYEYEQKVSNAYIEVVNQLSSLDNLSNAYDLKTQQVQALTESVEISNNLFRSARADYMEVLMTQRDALESKFDLVETKMMQMHAMVGIYRALGGGWQ